MRFCHVKPCEEKDLPVELQDDDENSKKEAPHDKYMKENQNLGCKEDYNKELDLVNKSISEKQIEELQKWSEHDEAQDNFCVLDDHQEKAEYVDLLLNPESKLRNSLPFTFIYARILYDVYFHQLHHLILILFSSLIQRVYWLSRTIRPQNMANNLQRKLFQIP